MKKNIIKIIAIYLIGIVGCYILILASAKFYWSIIAMGASPQVIDRLEKNIINVPSAKLITRLKALDNPLSVDHYSPYPSMALRILSDRGEREAVPYLLELLKSRKVATRINAISALNHIKDPRAIKPLLDMIKTRSQSDPDYFTLLDALAVFQSNEVYPKIIKMVSNNNLQMSAIDMLQNYPENSETQVALKQIAENNPSRYVRDKAYSALEKIKKMKDNKFDEEINK